MFNKSSLMRFNRPITLLCVAAMATIAIYWPGLRGGFVFDDYPNIIHNAAIHITHFDAAQLQAAALSSPSDKSLRPLAFLSFALNWWVSGADPWAMKFTNLLIHVLNGFFLYFVLSELHRAQRASDAERWATHNSYLALAVAIAWMLLPINLTSVLYVVQRMESLCQTFVLAGLWIYFRGRRLASAEGRYEYGIGLATFGLVFGTGVGVLVKESAVLLPLYAFLADAIVLNFRTARSVNDRHLWVVYMLTLLLPLLAGVGWLLPKISDPTAWAARSFSLTDRLLTEARVLLDYIRWTLLPMPGELGLFHDDITISRGPFAPPTTLVSIGAIASLLLLALYSAARRPWVSLGILWFFAAHALTATIIPLELVEEHRNYFASIGLLIALFAILQDAALTKFATWGRVALFALIALYGLETWHRARDWSNPTIWAVDEALNHPNSTRANYQAGQALVALSEYKPSAALDAGTAYFRRAAALPDASILPDQALIIVADRVYQQDLPEVWANLIDKLDRRAPTQEEIGALTALSRCHIEGLCRLGQVQVQNALEVALVHAPASVALLQAYADFSQNVLRDTQRAAVLELRATAAEKRGPHQ